jgi:hypothetical protein
MIAYFIDFFNGLLCSRYQRLLQKGKPKGKVITCIARELAGFIWALGNMELVAQAA